MRELDKVLNDNEKVLWEGRPSFWPFFFNIQWITTIFAIFWMGFLLSFIAFPFGLSGPFRYFIFLTPHFWIGLFMLFGPTVYRLLVFRHTYYAITDKRVIFQTGWIGRDFEVVDFDQITNADVNVGFFDKFFGRNTGSISVFSAGSVVYNNRTVAQRPQMISNVINPYEVFKFLKKVSHDVKTDIEYPNKLRPAENPGYQTNYDPNKK